MTLDLAISYESIVPLNTWASLPFHSTSFRVRLLYIAFGLYQHGLAAHGDACLWQKGHPRQGGDLLCGYKLTKLCKSDISLSHSRNVGLPIGPPSSGSFLANGHWRQNDASRAVFASPVHFLSKPTGDVRSEWLDQRDGLQDASDAL